MNATILQGDVMDRLKELPDRSVHCVVTSPPYWGLRDYKVEGQIGLEDSPDAWVAALVRVFSEVKRVLRDDGTLWLNVGDAYAAGKTGRDDYGSETFGLKDSHRNGKTSIRHGTPTRQRKPPKGLKPKDLIGLPWMLAFALRADGWYLRSDIIWAKPNPMPESCTDRPTSAHEHVFLLTKSRRYFYDAEAVRTQSRDQGEGAQETSHRNGRGTDKQRGHSRRHAGFNDRWDKMSRSEQIGSGANMRNVWTIATEPFPDAHFATFPTKLVEPCIKAGTSAMGCCPECLSPLERVIEKGDPDLDHQRACGGDAEGAYAGNGTKDYDSAGAEDPSEVKARILKGMLNRCTIGWEETCDCIGDGGAIPCTVLDPFSGSGTTGVVSLRLNRAYIGIELNPDYAEMSRRRIEDDLPMFNVVR